MFAKGEIRPMFVAALGGTVWSASIDDTNSHSWIRECRGGRGVLEAVELTRTGRLVRRVKGLRVSVDFEMDGESERGCGAIAPRVDSQVVRKGAS